MGKTVRLLALAAVASAGCARTVPLSPDTRQQLLSRSAVPVAYETRVPPSVECPNTSATDVWCAPDGRAMLERQPGSTSAAAGPAVWAPSASSRLQGRFVPAASGGCVIWEQIQDQRTLRLRQAPPVDPAGATAERFLALSSQGTAPAPFSEHAVPLQGEGPGALARQLGPGPVLVFRTLRWDLVGCFYTYVPWFAVRATVFDPASGKVLWRDSCNDGYPPDEREGASVPELEAAGKALFARLTETRAQECAAKLLASFRR